MVSKILPVLGFFFFSFYNGLTFSGKLLMSVKYMSNFISMVSTVL